MAENNDLESSELKNDNKETSSNKKGKKAEEPAGMTAKEIVGKTITLKNDIIWSNGDDLHLSAIADDNGEAAALAQIPKGKSDSYYKHILNSLAIGQIQLTDKETKVAVSTTILNEDTLVDQMEEIDYFLHLGPTAFSKQIEEIVQRRPNAKTFLTKVLASETEGRNRADYVEALKKHMI